MDSMYTIIVKDKTFLLTKEQIQFDSPNYFTTYFLGEFKEGNEGKQTLSFQRHPVLFELIVDYLTGYDIFPLPGADSSTSQSTLIPTMSPLALLNNLKKDALFYGLDGLCEQVDEQLEEINKKLNTLDVTKPLPEIKYNYYLLVSTVIRT